MKKAIIYTCGAIGVLINVWAVLSVFEVGWFMHNASWWNFWTLIL